VGAAFANRISYVISPEGKILYAYSDSNAEKHIENTLAVVRKWATSTSAERPRLSIPMPRPFVDYLVTVDECFERSRRGRCFPGLRRLGRSG
jgi:hypothetical protein